MPWELSLQQRRQMLWASGLGDMQGTQTRPGEQQRLLEERVRGMSWVSPCREGTVTQERGLDI